MDYMIKQSFMVTADKEFLKLRGQTIIPDLPANVASGNICFTGVVGTVIPLNTIFTLQNSNIEFGTLEIATLSNAIFNPIWISSCEQIVTVTIQNHQLTDGNYIITGAINSIFNGSWDMEVINKNNLTFKIDDSRTYSEDPNNMVAILTASMVTTPIQSIDTGLDKNLDSYTILEPQTTITGLDSSIILPNGLTGGRDDETVEEYRKRLLLAIRNPRTPFSKSHITGLIKETFLYVTRVFIRENYPSFNGIMIYCVDDYSNPITLTPTQLTEIRDLILDIRPINLPEVAIQTDNPTLKVIAFNVSGIIPNSNGLKETVKSNLENYFLTLEVGQDILKDNVNTVIAQSIDYNTGLRVENYTSDLENIEVLEDELPILNAVIV